MFSENFHDKDHHLTHKHKTSINFKVHLMWMKISFEGSNFGSMFIYFPHHWHRNYEKVSYPFQRCPRGRFENVLSFQSLFFLLKGRLAIQVILFI